MRKKGENLELITGTFESDEYYGNECPTAEGIKRSHLIWQKYASPVWLDIRYGNTLNFREARSETDGNALPAQVLKNRKWRGSI